MRRARSVPLLLLLAVMLATGADASGATKAPSRKEMAKLARAVAHAPLPARARRAAVRDTRRAAARLRRRKPCPASASLLRVHKRLVGRKARGQRARRLRRVALRTSRVRGKILTSLPEGKSCGGRPTVDVDRRIKPSRTSLPGLSAGAARPLARIVDAEGNRADFVANELWFSGTSEAARALARRWSGEVLRTLAPQIEGFTPQHLIRIDPRKARNGRLSDDLARLAGKVGGTVQRVSSELGLDLLTVAAHEARRDVRVGINWVGSGGSIIGGFTVEASDGPTDFNTLGAGWNRDAFNWKHLAAGTRQDMGVPSAWQLLARAQRLERNSVRLAVLDMGFAPESNGSDFGSDVIAFSNVPGANALGTPNLLSCGSPCPWHGTNVINAAAALPDNGFGAAGPGGPVVRPVVIFTLYDFFTGIFAATEAFALGARVSNMSYGAGVPAAFSWTVIPFELTTAALRAAGMVQFAAAGNDDTDVDAEDCFFACWEETLHTPCENRGVVCIGALGHDSLDKADYSNFGGEGVDLWAPGRVLVGATPRNGGVHAVQGTSFASPYAAGVAALMLAAEPGLGPAQIEGVMARTARRGSGSVGRILSPFAAVRDALPALIVMNAPTDGSRLQRGSGVHFDAFTYEDGRGSPSITWTLGGSTIGTGASFSRSDLPYGTHDIRVTARFPDGAAVADTAQITLENTAPSVDITAPSDGSEFFRSQVATFRASSVDVNQPESEYHLRNEEVAWFVDGSTTPWATGHVVTRSFNDLALGTHTIRVVGTDERGATATDSITISVREDPPDLPPNVQITGENCPPDPCHTDQGPDSTGHYYRDVTFTTSASDPEGQPISYEWYKSTNGGPFELVSGATSANQTIRLHWVGPCEGTGYVIRVIARDPAGNAGQDDFPISIHIVC